MNSKGNIFNIQHFSIYDGPGVRTTVFFKGCNLSCKWCHNPESISPKSQFEFYSDRCIGCGACFKACPNGVHVLDDKQMHTINRAKCIGCLACADVCFANAITAVGKYVDADYVFDSIMEDYLYYSNSKGGVTFSGGECMLQTEFLYEILKRCREKGIHTAVDTAGNVPWSSFERILPVTDLFLYDIKAADTAVHKLLTGAGNVRILNNLERLSASGKQILVRIPFVPGCNDGQIPGIAGILKSLNISRVEVMPYHKLGDNKYTALGMDNELKDVEVPTEAVMDRAVEILVSEGLNAVKT
ncbi:glycyl-radical enzyme activating protein [Ruminiclostridium cellobioparum]|uniref:glycyl-radical enzyme activating protein n=1 Tax=Ruminiclostridium cellobioparum TaxID=29355 RepID=UPI0004869345|nr:glycyl-radical enzyme activating protein [Ruminiclostridium cellobioparum]